jgi:hypothetical protein
VTVEPRAPVSRTGTLVVEFLDHRAGFGVLIDRESRHLAPPPGVSFSPSSVERSWVFAFAVAPQSARNAQAPGAARLGIGHDHLHVRAGQILPILDVFRIALAHEKADRRSVRAGVVRQFLLPARLDQPGALDRDNVPGEGQSDDIGS